MNESNPQTSVIDIRTSDLSEFESGESIRVHYRDSDSAPSKCVTGRVALHYTDEKALIETEDGRDLIVNFDFDRCEIYDFETNETLGRPIFAESAYHPEETGEELRERRLAELRAEEEEDEDEQDDTEALWNAVGTEVGCDYDVTLRYESLRSGSTLEVSGRLEAILGTSFDGGALVLAEDDGHRVSITGTGLITRTTTAATLGDLVGFEVRRVEREQA